MSQVLAASSQANQREVDELVAEIAFQGALLKSIDDTVENREEAEKEVRTEIKALQKQLRALTRPAGTTTSASQSTSTPSQPAAVTASSSNSRNGTTMDDFSSGPYNGHRAKAPSHNPAASSSTSSTPNSYDSLPDIVSPSMMNLPTRKRSHSKHLDGALAPSEDNKSRRTSPSPFMTDPTTPSASSGDEEFEAFDRSFFVNQQKVQEERLKQEKLDEEFARSLQSGGQGNSFAAARPAAPSAFDRLSGVRPPPSFSASSNSVQYASTPSSRILPWAKPSAPAVKSEPRSMLSNVKREEPSCSYDMGSYTNSPSMNSFKTEPSSSRKMPGAFVDDSSTASDSDLEIIGPEAFQDNGRHVATQSGSRPSFLGSVYGTPQPKPEYPSLSPEAQLAGEAALRRVEQAATNSSPQMALFGTQSVPAWMNNTFSRPNSSQSLPGSYPHPGIGMSRNVAYGTPQAYGGGMGGSFAYPSAAIGGGGLSSNGDMYPDYAGGNMQNAGPFLGPSLNNIAGSVYGDGNMGVPIDVDYRSPSPALGGTGQGDLMSDIFNRPSNAIMGEQYDYIMNDPRKTHGEIKALLENIRSDEELPVESREGTPDGLTYALYEHQKIALTWMKSMETGTNKGGILADDMGLGKTISTLALMLSRPSTDRRCKTTLIVGPVALLKQWEREIQTKVKLSHALSIHMKHGSGKTLSWDELRVYDVVLTTYGTLGSEFKKMEKWTEEQKLAGREYDQTPMAKLFPILGPKSVFYRVVLDEAQNIKNKSTNASRAAKQISSKSRFCLTGTPMMNNVDELYSLIHFLRIRPYNEWTRFRDTFGKLTKGDASLWQTKDAMRKLQAVLKAILLRRTKTSLIDGKPIINLPPKTEEVQHVVFNEDEQTFYNSLESKTQIIFSKYLRANTVGKNYSNVLVLLLRLRQACCHPHLIMDCDEAPPAGVDLTAETMIDLAKNLAPDVVGRLLAAEGFDCPVCYDGVENPSIVIPCGHDTCAECLSKISDQNNQQNEEEDGARSTLKCPTCRGKIDLKKIIDYTTFKKVHMADKAGDDVASVDDDSETQSEDDSDSDSETGSESGDDEDYRGNLRGFVVPDDVEEFEGEDNDQDGDDEAERAPKRKSKSKKSKKDKRRKYKGKKKEEKQHMSISMLKKEASKTAAGRRKYMRYLRKNWQPSAKVDKCVELLQQFQNDGKKTIIFSQFVALLDLLQVLIDEKGWKCERYDGSMSAKDRHAAINRFTDTPNTKIMLISLKAGNAGLNLVAASRVIILDPFWNPFIEMQAVDRAYRIGQQHAVEVHRILIERTVEDRILELQEQKRTLVNSALDEGASKSLGRLTVNQLSYLFGVGSNPN